MALPSRPASAAVIAAAEADLAGVLAEERRLKGVMDLRRKQFALLLRCLDDLGADAGGGAADAQPPLPQVHSA